MNRLFVVPLVLLTLVVSVQAQKPAPAKFSKSEQVKFPKACGDGLDEHSACGGCARVGIAITKSTSCGHVCVELPGGKTDKNMDLVAQAAEDNGLASTFKACGSRNTAGACEIGWARFEGLEYYPDKNNLCGRFKNWSHDRDRIFKVIVSEK
jgi:hypothetical protein